MEARGYPSLRQRWSGASGLARWAAVSLGLVALLPPALGSRGWLALGLTAAAVLLAAGLLRRTPERPPRRLLWPAAGWLCGLVVSALLGGSPGPAALLPAFLGAAALLVGWLLRRGGEAELAMGGICAGAVLAALHAAAQSAGWDPIPRADHFPYRIVGPFANPNHLGGFLAAALPLLLAAGLGAWGSPGGIRWRPALGLGLAGLLLFGILLLAGSRGALAGCLAGVAVAAAGHARAVRLGRRRARPGGPLVLLAAAAGVVLLLRHETGHQQPPRGDLGRPAAEGDAERGRRRGRPGRHPRAPAGAAGRGLAPLRRRSLVRGGSRPISDGGRRRC